MALRSPFTALMLTLYACSTPALSSQTQPELGIRDKTPQLTVLSHARIVVEPGRVLEDASLVLNNGVIEAVLEQHETPEGAFVVNMRGKTLYPGFIDPYTSYGIDWQYQYPRMLGPVYSVNLNGGKHHNTAIHGDMLWTSHFNSDEKTRQNWLNNGFTSVQTAHLDGLIQGRAATVSLKDGDSQELIYRPKASHFTSFSPGTSPMDNPSSVMGAIALLRQTLSDANWYHQQKQKSLVGQLDYNATLEALSNIENDGVVFAATDAIDTLRALNLFAEFDINPAIVGTGLEFERVEELKQANATLILPLKHAAKPKILDSAESLNISLEQLRQWERSPANPALLANAGIPIAFTQFGIESDQFWPRLKQAVTLGLSEADALAALTTVPAQLAGIANQAGKLAPGSRADIVVADGNLFVDGTILGLYLQGEYQPLEADWQSDYVGQFNLTLGSNELVLSISAKDDGLKGEFSSGDRVFSLQDISVNKQRLSFKTDMNEIDFDGVSIFTLMPSEDGLVGNLRSANGELAAIELTRDSESATDPEKEKTKAEFLSRQTYPNLAFGFETKPKPQQLHIRNATVWTASDQGTLEQTDVLVSNGVIESIGPNLATPTGYQALDAEGLHLTPGLIDEHSHIAIYGGVNEFADNITSDVRIGDVLDPSDIHIYRALAGGVTTAQLLHGSANPIGGQAQIIRLRWGENAEGLKFKQAPASIKFALGENPKQSNWGDQFVTRYPQTRMGVESIIRDGFIAAKEYRQHLRKYQSLSETEKRQHLAPRINYRLEALVEILEDERHIHVHSYVQSEIMALLKLAEEQDFKVQTFTHILDGYKVAPEMVKAGTTASTFSDWWAYKFEVYDAIPHNACLLTDAGLITSINSDSEDLIRRLNQEAAKSSYYCDMSAEDALKMVTINPAIQLKIDQQVGSIEVGKQADLVLWDNPPMSVYAKALTTWIQGTPYFDRQRDQQERLKVKEERNALIQKVITDDKPAEKGEIPAPKGTTQWHCDSLTHFHFGQLHLNHHGGH